MGPSGKESRTLQPSGTVLARCQHRRHGEQTARTAQTTQSESCRREEVALAGWARRLSAGEGSRVANSHRPRSSVRWAVRNTRCWSNYKHILANSVVRRE